MAASRTLTSAVLLVVALVAVFLVVPSLPASAQPDDKEIQPLDPDEISTPRLDSDGEGDDDTNNDKESDLNGESDLDDEGDDKEGDLDDEGDGSDDADESDDQGATDTTALTTPACNGQIDDRPFVDGTTLALSADGHDHIASISFQGPDPANPRTDVASSSPWTAALITTRSRVFFTDEGTPCVGSYGEWYGDEEPAFRCAGTLIDPEWILTAAHCVSDHKPRGVSGFIGIVQHDLQVRLGSAEWNENGDLHDVAEIHIHPDWSRQAFDDGTWVNDSGAWTGDLALLRLASPATQEPAMLGTVADSDLGIAQATRGWGINEQGDRPSSRLWWSNNLVDDDRCETNDSTDTYVADESLCVDVLNGFGACFGDSGSAIGTTNGIANNTATSGFTLTGVASYMIFSYRTGSNETRCDDPRYVAYTHIDGPRLDWVLDTIG